MLSEPVRQTMKRNRYPGVAKLVTPPASLAVPLEDLKAHLRVVGNDEDTLLASYLEAATEFLQDEMNRAFVAQTWRYSLPVWPEESFIILPRAPLLSVTTLDYTDKDDSTTTMDTSLYTVNTEGDPGRIELAYNEQWPTVTLRPTNPIQITYVAGYADVGDVPFKHSQLIKLVCAHWYENREPVIISGAVPKEIPMAAERLLWNGRVL